MFVDAQYYMSERKLNRKQISEKFTAVIEKPMLTSFLVLVLLAFLVIGASWHYYQEDYYNFVGQVLAEAHGMLFDITVIGILIYWLNENGQRRQRIRMYKDEIEDFRLWESEEAAFRTVGNVKRLNRHKIYDVDLVNCYLARTNLSYVILQGANLNSANVTQSQLVQCNLAKTRLNRTDFEGSNLNQANLSQAYASGANFKDSFMIKTHLEKASLIKATFQNAFLMEACLKGANVVGANFDNANLYKADLREVEGITVEQLKKAKTLYQAQLDPDILEQVQMECSDLLLR